jgi:hypothetical protein
MPKLPNIAAFAADPPVHTFRCSGCGTQDTSAFNKAGVEHWRRTPEQREVVCGQWVLTRGPRGLKCAPTSAMMSIDL